MQPSMDSKVQEKEPWQKSFLETMKTVKETWFALHTVTTSFNSTSAFSEASFQLAAHVKGGTSRVGFYVKDFFQVDGLKREHEKALTYIMNCHQKPWPVRAGKKSEKQVVLDICTQILMPLCREEEVIVEMKYRSFQNRAVPRCGYIGMGSTATWHGTPDVRVRGADVVIAEEGAEVTTDSDESAGATMNVEAKVNFGVAHLPQLITTCVVASFTEKRLHPALQALVPTLLMEQNRFRVCLYHCDKDLLLLSQPTWLAEDGALSKVGLAFLWLVINHR